MKNLSYWYIDIIKISHEKEVIQVWKKKFYFYPLYRPHNFLHLLKRFQ